MPKQRQYYEEPTLNKTTRRTGVNSRAKGASFERNIAKEISVWYGAIWRRTPQSGGWSKTADFGVAGDLVTARKTKLHFELKNRENWDLTDLLLGVRKNEGILAWLSQAERDARNNKKTKPVLVFRRNRLKDSLVCHKKDCFTYLGVVKKIIYKKYVFVTLNDFLRYAVPPDGPNAKG